MEEMEDSDEEFFHTMDVELSATIRMFICRVHKIVHKLEELLPVH